MPLSARSKSKETWNNVIEKCEKKLTRLKGQYLSLRRGGWIQEDGLKLGTLNRLASWVELAKPLGGSPKFAASPEIRWLELSLLTGCCLCAAAAVAVTELLFRRGGALVGARCCCWLLLLLLVLAATASVAGSFCCCFSPEGRRNEKDEMEKKRGEGRRREQRREGERNGCHQQVVAIFAGENVEES
ncbi:hypothetical protein MTR67_027430 [Solanum verrucosum]|uniref:Transmembrane protein n=1 Tax=Solanum verrucosum TaxID=315347 RepID=A0AAF0TZK6_SOLVR|nr:hypothetical protein MTR67_027430 [Solanum verrucosum]